MRNFRNIRWLICGLLFFSVAINYIDRLVISILKGPISESLHWSDSDYGYIAAFFSFAYAFGYLIGGRAIDGLGVKKGLLIFVFLWSCAASLHGLVSFVDPKGVLTILTLTIPTTAAAFIVARIALGLTEGANFPAAIKTVAEWFPIRERALATGVFNAGTNVGAVLCPIAVPWLYLRYGWPTTFYLTGGIGFLWLIAWWFTYEEPDRHRWVTRKELDYIRDGQPPVPEPEQAQKPERIPWSTLLRQRPVWAYIFASILAGPAWGFYQFFIPDFLGKRFSLSIQEIGWWTGVFFGIAAFGGIAGGWLAGFLLARGWSLGAARKVTLLICALAVVPVLFAPYAPSVILTVVIVALGGAAHQGWSANLYSIVSDTMPRAAISSVIGLGGFLSYFTGGFVNGLVGHLVQKTGSYSEVFAYFSGTYLVSILLIHLLIPRFTRA